jgi:hypothetical protein
MSVRVSGWKAHRRRGQHVSQTERSTRIADGEVNTYRRRRGQHVSQTERSTRIADGDVNTTGRRVIDRRNVARVARRRRE